MSAQNDIHDAAATRSTDSPARRGRDGREAARFKPDLTPTKNPEQFPDPDNYWTRKFLEWAGEQDENYGYHDLPEAAVRYREEKGLNIRVERYDD